MGKIKDDPLFPLIRSFLKDYLPEKRNCSVNTIKAYRISLDQLLEYTKAETNQKMINITFDTLGKDMITAFLDYLEGKNNCSITTRNHRLHCIRSFFDYAAKTDSTLVSYQLEVNKIPFKKSPKSNCIEYLTENAIKALLLQPDVSTPKDIRDQFLMILMYDSAARIQEIINLRLCDIRITDTAQIKLHGKGDKLRTVPLMQETVQHYKRYLSIFHEDAVPYSEKPLFYTIRKDNCNPISDDAIRKLLNRYAKTAHQSCPDVPEQIHPHLFRHSRAMHLYQHGMDLTLISQWLGHAFLSSTLVYAHADTEMKRKAIEKATDKYFPKVDAQNSPYDINDDEVLKKLYGLKP